ncbi:protein of unknown function DUF4216 - like 6 [Theobroma cacao]|nr:protein of unknown function DUF4216 - like 6 [Theobroma cacao]
MHIERNVFENIFNTMMDVKGKTKDNLKARQDLKVYCKWPELELVKNNGKIFKPKAAFTLNKKEIKNVCAWVKQLRLPDGFVSNISRSVNESDCKFHGMKSHDCHVFLQRLLPIVFHDTVPYSIWDSIIGISHFFRDLCATEIPVDHMEALQGKICETICKLEKIFPPSFFDSMEHLSIHLPYEVKVGGPVQLNRVPRNDDGGYMDSQGRLSIFTHLGQAFGLLDKSRFLDEDEFYAAELYVLMNCEEMVPYIKTYDKVLQRILSNGFKFHTLDYGQNRKTINSGVCIKGSFYNDYERDFYGIKVDPLHGLIEIKCNSILASNEPFILVAQAHQVYYSSYPSRKRDQRDWWVVFKTKARSRYNIPSSGDGENEIDLNEQVYQEDVSISMNATPSEELDNLTVLASGDYEEVNLLIDDEDNDMQRDEDEEDDMEGDENEDDDEEEDELEDDASETLSDDSGTMVKGKHSKPRPRSTNTFGSASAKQIENETSTHDSRRSLSIDLGASVDDTSSRSRGRGLSVGL